ncbi:uncharacterized protein LOC126894605 [Daktulosphaira vitifoliae]|uniref:uncharacterized protein LOC126894605 n=1 Tax=Daktulosphaira vitifoliae TaxID=58002 RepID=UPI0021AA5C7A|nr:uncharacterized protein LOC126894605 [Daktulosphaira vitifoliae]
MIHGPCNFLNPDSVCMKDNGDGLKCTKNFPKDYRNDTVFDGVNGYPLYARPQDGRYTLRKVDGQNIKMTNNWVVPYNPWLLSRYACHLNVEICSSIKSVKYLYKYVYKSHDSATLQLSEGNEISNYLDTRYVSAPEAMWRIFAFKIHDSISHIIHRLPIHLPGMQIVTFREGQEVLAVENAQNKLTQLEAFFKLNASRSNDNNSLFYLDLPTTHHFSVNNQWELRKRYIKNIIGRMYSVSPQEQERFALRILLLHRPNPTSFEDLRTVDGNLKPSFVEAAKTLGLLEDNRLWRQTMAELALSSMPVQIRNMFAYILAYNGPTDALDIFEEFYFEMTEDYNRAEIYGNQSRYMCLRSIEDVLEANGRHLHEFGLELPEGNYIEATTIEEVNQQHLEDQAITMYEKLNPEQQQIYNMVLDAINNPQTRSSKIFFVNGAGGTGKTTLYKALNHKLKSQGKITISVAFTGIAASLLQDGTTVHSAFGLPLNICETSTSSLRHSSKQAIKIKDSPLIIWDEAPMSASLQVSAVDKLLRDLMQNNSWFGGKPILFGGDFRQVLPVVQRGNRAQIVNACIKCNPMWPFITQCNLTTNMRAQTDPWYSEYILNMGNDKIPKLPCSNLIRLENEFLTKEPIQNFVFPRTMEPCDMQQYADHVILCPRNLECHVINDNILNRINASEHIYNSIDSIDESQPADAINYPTEFLNTIQPTGFPPHRLRLKIGAIITLLRNLDKTKGLCNGTRLVVKKLHNHSIEAKMFNNNIVLIPRIDLVSTNDPSLPFTLRRRQFPVRLAFACTINKSQGQTYNKVGLLLDSTIFSHGQLYVAFSRVRSRHDIKVSVKDLTTQGRLHGYQGIYVSNIVYPEVLNDI